MVPVFTALITAVAAFSVMYYVRLAPPADPPTVPATSTPAAERARRALLNTMDNFDRLARSERWRSLAEAAQEMATRAQEVLVQEAPPQGAGVQPRAAFNTREMIARMDPATTPEQARAAVAQPARAAPEEVDNSPWHTWSSDERYRERGGMWREDAHGQAPPWPQPRARSRSRSSSGYSYRPPRENPVPIPEIPELPPPPVAGQAASARQIAREAAAASRQAEREFEEMAERQANANLRVVVTCRYYKIHSRNGPLDKDGKYHITSECSALAAAANTQIISLTEALRLKFTPCSRCQ
jgi:hypothetical protein